jgi:hypothetical protein
MRLIPYDETFEPDTMSGTLKKAWQLKVDAGFSFGCTTGHIRIAKL